MKYSSRLRTQAFQIVFFTAWYCLSLRMFCGQLISALCKLQIRADVWQVLNISSRIFFNCWRNCSTFEKSVTNIRGDKMVALFLKKLHIQYPQFHVFLDIFQILLFGFKNDWGYPQFDIHTEYILWFGLWRNSFLELSINTLAHTYVHTQTYWQGHGWIFTAQQDPPVPEVTLRWGNPWVSLLINSKRFLQAPT